MYHRTPNHQSLIVVLFILALLPRLPGLGQFITSDERTNIFMAGSDVIAAFLAGDWRATYWHFYPGVTMSWLDALGMLGQYLLLDPNEPFSTFIYHDIRTLLVASRLPYVLLTALFVPILYLLAQRLMPRPVALFGTLLVAFDPFLLAHSKVVHGDAPVAVFMTVSTLALFVFFKERRASGIVAPASKPQNYFPNALLLLSAVSGSLAALTKAPGQFMAIFVIVAAVAAEGLRGLHSADLGKLSLRSSVEPVETETSAVNTDDFDSLQSRLQEAAKRATVIIASWGTLSLLVFILLWPSMWVDPVGTLQKMLDETFGKVNEGHLVFFFGQPMLDPGPWFYPYVIPFRLTPITLIGSGLALILLIVPAKYQPVPPTTLRWLWFFTFALLLFGLFSPKKQDRYLLPLFPFLGLLAGIGWMGTIRIAAYLLRQAYQTIEPSHTQHRYGTHNTQCILILLHALPMFTFYPYYLTYFNPLLGGPEVAAQTTLIGWGEGMEQVADYLNQQPNAESLYVAATPSQTLLPYFVGTGENFYTNDIAFRADYVVLYIAQMQRLAPSPEIVRYYQRQTPEKVISIHGLDYAKIYRNDKRILTDIPPTATPLNIGLGDVMRIAGYEWTDAQTLTLYWHALAPMTENYTISVRGIDAQGAWLAQQDSWPLNGLLPTSQWRPGDYVADSHTLDVAGEAVRYEVVVYQAETRQTLGQFVIRE